jgi:hypothetical protein
MSINLEKIILDSPIYIEICNYLQIKDIKNTYILTKKIYCNKNNENYSKYLIKSKSIKIIIHFFKKYLIMIKKINNNQDDYYLNNDKKFIALYYFKFYDKKYIKSFYNMSIPWKKDIINKYKTKFTENPTRFDLYNLIKLMPIEDTLSVGW